MARLVQLIVLVAALWPLCQRRDRSCFRRRTLAAGSFLATLREQQANTPKADAAQGSGEPAAVLHSSPGALRQRSGLLLKREPAVHSYAFSSEIFSSLLLLCMAAIQSP